MAGQTEFLQAIQELERLGETSYLWKKSILIFLT